MVGGNIDQNEPLSLDPMSFGLKLMDREDLEFYIHSASIIRVATYKGYRLKFCQKLGLLMVNNRLSDFK